MDTDIPPVETNFLLKPIPSWGRRSSWVEAKWSKMRKEETSRFEYANLRPGQQEIYNYVHNNPKNIVVVQGYPGSGKTFTLRAIAHSWKKPVNVIIYKHDLLNDFQGIAECRTKAKFFMDMFRIHFETLKDFEKHLIGNLSASEFLLAIVNFIAKADIDQLHGSLVILDEYTVMPKALLLVTIMLLKYYKIGAILCGDKSQLLNEKSEIMGNCTSFDIANDFADKSFGMQINETDSEYNRIVNFIRELVSDNWIDDYARSVIAAVFPKQLFGLTKFTDTHLAGSHKELKEIADDLVSHEDHPSRPYMIKTCDSELEECSTPEKFLGYLPLVVGSSYYVDQQSEDNKMELVSVDNDLDEVLLRSNEGVLIARQPNSQYGVIPYRHQEELLPNVGGSIHNFPIYPANFMTVLKSQGRQVSGPLHIKFGQMSYRGMYVAFSRVKDISQVVHVSIASRVSHLASCVVNFPEMVDPNFKITAALLKKRMFDYKYYFIIETSSIERLLQEFFFSESKELRTKIRDELVPLVERTPFKSLLNPPDMGDNWEFSPIKKILKYKDYFFGLSTMKEQDRGIWLYEFLARTPAMRSLTENKNKHISEDQLLYTMADLYNLPEWGCNMMDFISKQPNAGNSRFRKEIYDKYQTGRQSEITTKWLVDFLNGSIRVHKKIYGALPEECKKEKSMDQDEEVSAEDEDEEDESDGEETDSSLESQNSMEGQTIEERASSSMKRGNQEVEADGDIATKKKKMNNPFNI